MNESFEDQVRNALVDQAGRIHPSDRLADIKAAAQTPVDPEATAVIPDASRAGSPRTADPETTVLPHPEAIGDAPVDDRPADVVPLRPRRSSTMLGWLAVAAVTVLVAGVAVGAMLRGGQAASSEAGAPAPRRTEAAQKDTATSSAAQTGATPPAGSPSATAATSSASGTVRAEPWAMPVYYPATGTAAKPWLLVRDFVTTSAPADRAARVQLAVNALVSGTANGEPLPYETMQHPWRLGTTAETTVSPSEITVTLSQPLVDGLTPEQARIAGQAIAWTATAAAQQTVPVRLQAGSAAPVTVSRPETGQEWNDLAPIWVVTPARLAQVSAGKPIAVTGEACTFEGAYGWQVLKGEGVVQSGTGQATSGCPARGTFAFQVPGLQAGAYTLRVYETSAADGKVAYEAKVPLIVA